MISDSKQSAVVFHGVVRAGWCLGLCLGPAAVSTGAGQDRGPIKVAGHEPAKPETPFACSLEKSLTKDQREHKKQIAIKMEGGRLETKELANGYLFRFRPDAVSFSEVADWVA